MDGAWNTSKKMTHCTVAVLIEDVAREGYEEN